MKVYENLPSDTKPSHLRAAWETEVVFCLYGKKGDETRKQLFARRDTIPGWYIKTPEKRLDLIREASHQCLCEILQVVKSGVLHYRDGETGELVPFEFNEWRVL